jgi:hypothetical protein
VPRSTNNVNDLSVEFEYRLTGAGWSKARFSIGASPVQLSASYLDDALGDLVDAVAKLGDSTSTVRVSWA